MFLLEPFLITGLTLLNILVVSAKQHISIARQSVLAINIRVYIAEDLKIYHKIVHNHIYIYIISCTMVAC